MPSPDIPDMRGCPVMPMGAIPRLFIAVAQAFGSDMGIPNELESIAILRRPSIQKRREKYDIKHFISLPLYCTTKITNILQNCRLNQKARNITSSFGKVKHLYKVSLHDQNDFRFTYENEHADTQK